MPAGPINLYEYEALAKSRLQPTEYDFIAGGATDEITLRRTRAAFDSIMLRPRMLVDISQMDLSTTVLGQRIPFPVLLDPAGGHGRAHPEAEVATVRAAGAVGTVMVLSSGSTRTLEDVAKAASGPLWFQQYLYRDRDLSQRMAHRAQEAGYSALCVTLDSTVRAKRERNIRNEYSSPTSPNYTGLALPDYSWHVSSDAPHGVNGLISRAATWSEVEWLATHTPLPVLVKGIMTAGKTVVRKGDVITIDGSTGQVLLGRVRELGAGIAVITENGRSKAIEVGVGRRHEVDRVAGSIAHDENLPDCRQSDQDEKRRSASARCTIRPATMVAITRGRRGSLASTRIRSARCPAAMRPRSVKPTAAAGASDTSDQAFSNGTMLSDVNRKAASSGAG